MILLFYLVIIMNKLKMRKIFRERNVLKLIKL